MFDTAISSSTVLSLLSQTYRSPVFFGDGRAHFPVALHSMLPFPKRPSVPVHIYNSSRCSPCQRVRHRAPRSPQCMAWLGSNCQNLTLIEIALPMTLSVESNDPYLTLHFNYIGNCMEGSGE